jgi:hypothetical protein
MFNWHIFYARIRGDDKKMENTSSIAYQNKDIASKVFAENFKGKSLKVYGLDVPKVVQVLPTNLPEITANELRIDNLFLLEDGTLAIIDYESIILPLTFREREQKQQTLRETINLARQITDLRQQTFVLSGTLVFADKIIDTETKQRVKEWIRMTQIGRMFEEEKEEAVREAVEATTKGTVINMLKEGLDTHMIIKLVPSYSLDDVLRLKQETGL